MVWKLVRQTGSGNVGYVNLRGVIDEGNVDKRATGFPQLVADQPTSPGGALIVDFNQAVGAFLATDTTLPDVVLAMIGAPKVGGTTDNPIYGPPYVRPVRSFVVDEAAFRDLTRKSRDQRGADPGDNTPGPGPTQQPGPPIIIYSQLPSLGGAQET